MNGPGVVLIVLLLGACAALNATEQTLDQARAALVEDIQQREDRLRQERGDIETARRERLQTLQDLVQQVAAAQEERRAAQTSLQRAEAELEQARSNQQHNHHQLRQILALYREHGLISNGQGLDDEAALTALRQAMQQRLDQLQETAQVRQSQASIYDRRGQAATVPVLDWGMAQRVALGSDAQQRGFLTRDDSGQWLIQGPHIASTAASQGAWADVSGRLASEPPRPRGIRGFIERGGPFVWPIFAIALVALLTALLRLGLRVTWRPPQGAAAALLRAPDVDQALQQARRWRGPIGRILVGILTSAPEQRQEIAGAVLAEAEVHLSHGLRLLAVLAAAAPLLGLLGTVTGMIASFEALGAQAGADAERLSAGIGQALLTTELGLIVAVPTLIVHALFARDASRWRSRCEAEALRLLSALDSLHHPTHTTPPPAAKDNHA